MLNTTALVDNVASDNVSENDKANLLILLNKIARQKESKARSAKTYFEKLKLNEDSMIKLRQQKNDYYAKNKELITERVRTRYNTDIAVKEAKKEKSKKYYHNKFDDVPKMTRGRKPPTLLEPAEPIIRRPRGRPPKNGYNTQIT